MMRIVVDESVSLKDWQRFEAFARKKAAPKGPFVERMRAKLDLLAAIRNSNEIVPGSLEDMMVKIDEGAGDARRQEGPEEGRDVGLESRMGPENLAGWLPDRPQTDGGEV